MRLEKIPIHRLVAAPYNPRKDLQPGDPEFENLKRSVAEFGFLEPLVWNRRTGHLVGGHQRRKVLIDLGYTEVDVVVVDLPLDPEAALGTNRRAVTEKGDLIGRWRRGCARQSGCTRSVSR